MNDSYEVNDLYISSCAKGFADSQKAKFRLNSIGGLALEKGFGLPIVLGHLKHLSNIAQQYNGPEQIQALMVLEERYAEALTDRNSRLLEGSKRESSSWQDPVERLFGRFQSANRTYGRVLTLNGLDRAAEDSFGAPRFVEKKMVWSNRKSGYVTSF
jgi:hypothetical protein